MKNRITVSLDKDSKEALKRLNRKSETSRSELVRNAISFYEANYKVADEYPSINLQRFYEMVASAEHVILDVDFLYLFLKYLYQEGNYDPQFLEEADRVSDYHAVEFSERFDSVEDLLDWLSFCGFITVRKEVEGVYHIVFPSDGIRWFMTRFIERSCSRMEADVEIESSVAKALLIESE